MPTSLFQYEMLPTTWFYLSTLLILAVFFRFNRLASVRNLDVLALIGLTPGLVYVAMGSALQGYLWLFIVGAFFFVRMTLDVFIRRRPILSPNMNYAGLAFSCVASSAFMIPNLFLNRGDACESPRAWRLEQILSAAEEADPEVGKVENWPGYRPFLQATRDVNRFFAPSQIAWRRAVADFLARKSESTSVDFFGVSIQVDSKRSKKRHAARAVRWASGASDDYEYDFEVSDSNPTNVRSGGAGDYPESLNGVRAAQVAPRAPLAQSVSAASLEDSGELSGTETDESHLVAETNEREEFEDDADEENVRIGDSALFRWQPLSQEGLLLVLCVIFLQIGVLTTIALIGRVHFGSLQTGFAVALLYLLLPYINQFSARLDHIVPTLLILLAILFYRRPFLSGMVLGVAGSLVFYPFFLIPLWFAYYLHKGAGRFIIGFTGATLTMAVILLFIKGQDYSYGEALASMFGRHSLFLAQADGIWEYLPRFYRIPLISLFGVFCAGFALAIPQKNLATLLSCSAALMIGVQFWMGRQGGLFMAWYLPLVILTVFRPNLADRTATASVVDLPS